MLPLCKKTILIPICLFLMLFACSEPEKAPVAENQDTVAAPAQPNFIIILADDMGYSDASCYGSEIPTPAIDLLAQKGLKFARFYNAGRCCPSRAALLTGLYPHRAGMGWMTDNEQHPSYQGRLSDRCMTIAELLATKGYKSYITGKWHVGDSLPHLPLQRGFADYWGINRGGKSHFYTKEFEQPLLRGNVASFSPKTAWYIGDSITAYAQYFIQNHQKNHSQTPFFLYVAYTAPHWPLHAPEEETKKHTGKYREGWEALRKERLRRLKELNLLNVKTTAATAPGDIPQWEKLSNKERAEWERKMEVHAAMITRMDAGIAQIMSTLNEQKLNDNTYVIFLSDNGASNEDFDSYNTGIKAGLPGSMEFIGSPWAHACNAPFSMYKSWMHEGGISTPMIVNGPKIANPGRTTEHVGHIIDLAPTIADLAGAILPDTFKGKHIFSFDGRSLTPLFAGGGRAEVPYFWEHEGNRAVMIGDRKLVSKVQGYWADPASQPGKWELYNMHRDRGETVNLAEFQPKQVQNLESLYEKWGNEYDVLPHKMHLEQRKRILGRYGW